MKPPPFVRSDGLKGVRWVFSCRLCLLRMAGDAQKSFERTQFGCCCRASKKPCLGVRLGFDSFRTEILRWRVLCGLLRHVLRTFLTVEACLLVHLSSGTRYFVGGTLFPCRQGAVTFRSVALLSASDQGSLLLQEWLLDVPACFAFGSTDAI